MWLAIVIVLPNVFFNDSEFYENKYSHLNNDNRVHDFTNEMFSYHMIKCAVLQNGVLYPSKFVVNWIFSFVI